MKTIKTECKSTVALALVIMLLFSMMSGCLTLSASADEVVFPKVLNRPTVSYNFLDSNWANRILYTDYPYCFSRDSQSEKGIFDGTMALTLDDSEAGEHKIGDIQTIKYDFSDKDKNVSVSGDVQGWRSVEGLDTVVLAVNPFEFVKAKMDQIAPIPFDGSKYCAENGCWQVYYKSVYDYENNRSYYINEFDSFYLSRAGYTVLLYELRQATINLIIVYNDGAEQKIPVNVVEGNRSVLMKSVENEGADGIAKDSSYVTDGSEYFKTYINTDTVHMALLRLAHSTNIDSETLLDLEKAIYSVEHGETTNRYYVDIDSKEDIILPMYTMSEEAELVQTRVGDDVVYNTGTAIDFDGNKIDALSGEEAPTTDVYSFKDGRDSFFKDGRYSDKTINMPVDCLSYQPLLDSVVSMGGTDKESYSSKWIILNGEPQYCQSNDKNLCGYDKAKLLDLVENGTYLYNEEQERYKYGEFGWRQRYVLTPASVLSLSDEQANEFAEKLFNLYKSSSSYEYSRFELYIYGRDSRGYSFSSNWYDYRNNLEDMKRYISQAVQASQIWKFYVTFCCATEPTELNELLQEYGLGIEYGNYDCSITDFSTFEQIPVKDVIDFKLLKDQPYKTLIYDNVHVDSQGEIYTGQVVNYTDYNEGEYNNIISDSSLSRDTTSKIITDTYNGKEVRFSPELLRTCKKGISYNVINQVRLNNYSGDSSVYGSSVPVQFSSQNLDDNSIASNGTVYYLDGELIRSYDYDYDKVAETFYTFYDSNGNTHRQKEKFATFRNSEYKWGELVLASKPDPVQDLTFTASGGNGEEKDPTETETDPTEIEKITLSWTKPDDEGFGVDENGKTRIDNNSDVENRIRVKTYTVKIYDEDSTDSETPIYQDTITREADKDSVSIDVSDLIKRDNNYKAVVIATNILGDSTEKETEIYIPVPSVEITMTPDQPVYRENDTVVYTETVTNTGKVKLTNVTVTQTQSGEYEAVESEKNEKGDIIVDENDPKKVVIPDLAPGESYTFTYKVPASQHDEYNIIVDEAVVTTKQQVTDNDEATVRVVHPNIDLTKTVEKKIYKEEETVVYTDVIVNTGDTPLRNVVVTEDNDKGEFGVADSDKPNVETTDKNNVVIIKEIPVGESVTLTYTIKVKDVERDENNHVVSETTAEVPNEKDLNVKAAVEYDIIHPTIQVTTTPNKDHYGDIEDIVYTDVVTNTGDYPLHSVVVAEHFEHGSYSENERGYINEDGNFVIEELAVGESVALTYTINASKAPVISNIVTNFVTADCDERVSDDDTSDVLIVHYQISVTKLVDSGRHLVGDDVYFTNIVQNTGDYKLTGIVVEEDLTGQFIITQEGAALIDGSLVIAELNPNEKYVYTYAVPYNEDFITDGRLLGKVTATASENAISVSSDVVVDSDTNSTTFYQPSIEVTKTVEDRDYVVGETVTWNDSITNNGECDLTNVVVTESLNGTFSLDYETTENTMIIPVIKVGETVEFTFTTVIDSEDVIEELYPCTVEAVARENVSDADSKAVTVIESEIPDDSDTDTETEMDSDITDTDTGTDSDVAGTETETDGDTTDTDMDTNGDVEGSDTDTETSSDTTDTETETDSDTTDTDTDTNGDVEGSDTDTETSSDTTDTETETDSDTTDTDTDTNGDVEGSDTDTETETDSDTTGTDTETETDKDTDKNSDTDTDKSTQTTNTTTNRSTPTSNGGSTTVTTAANSEKSPEVDLVKTGDARGVSCFAAIMMFSAVIGLALYRRRESK